VGGVLYHNDIYNHKRIDQLIEHFTAVLETVIADPKIKLSQLALDLHQSSGAVLKNKVIEEEFESGIL
jgi:hypothetical protein